MSSTIFLPLFRDSRNAGNWLLLGNAGGHDYTVAIPDVAVYDALFMRGLQALCDLGGIIDCGLQILDFGLNSLANPK